METANTTVTPAAKQYAIERATRILNSTYYDVEKRPCVEGGYEIVDQYGHRFAKVSEQYTLVKNRDIIQPIVEKFGVDSLTRCERSAGKVLYEVSTGRSIDIDGSGDLVSEKLVAINSYNKTKAYTFALGAFRRYCSNGMFSGMAFFNYKKIHIGNIPINELVQNVLETYTQNDFGLWKRMAQVPLGDSEARRILDDGGTREFKAFEVKPENELVIEGNSAYNEHINKNALRYWSENGKAFPRSVWGLYNAMNSAIAHEFRYKRSQFGKVMLANKNAEAYLSQRYELN